MGTVTRKGLSSWEPLTPAGPLARMCVESDEHSAQPTCVWVQEGLSCRRSVLMPTPGRTQVASGVPTSFPGAWGHLGIPSAQLLGVSSVPWACAHGSHVLCACMSPPACRVRACPETL